MAEDRDKDLIEFLADFSADPLGFVKYCFPWGKGDLKDFTGPEDWQAKLLADVRDGLRTPFQAIQIARASGHGIGKSTMVAWLILWALSTFDDTKGVVTANTDTQLKTKTWPELGKWHNLFIAKHLFTYTATAIYSVDPKHERTWRIDAIPWSKSNPEAFAGLHNKGRRVMLLFDEASAIPDAIWEVAEGALTDSETELLWFAFGNPTRNSGRFFECFHRMRHRWNTAQIDSRLVKITNKEKIAKWIEDYGEDSDFSRVRIRGVFPKVGDRQFISQDVIFAAKGREMPEASYMSHPKILTLDSAWEGGDEIVCGLRQGLAYKQLWVQSKNDNDADLARRLSYAEDENQASAVFIDQGYGTGVYSFGKELGRKWMLIPFGGEALNKSQYLNKRAEMWGLCRDWLRNGGAIPNDERLCEELASPEQVFREDGKIQLEAKKDIKERLGFSPGRADALVLSFAMPVQGKDYGIRENKRKKEYDAFAIEAVEKTPGEVWAEIPKEIRGVW